MPLVINSLGGGHTHKHTHTHMHTDVRTRSMLGNQARRRPARAWFNNVNDDGCYDDDYDAGAVSVVVPTLCV